MAKKETQAKVECVCCHVHHTHAICAQCQVAGCGGNKPGDACRLSSGFLAIRKLSEFQLQQRVQELEKQLKEITTEAQRLARELLARDEKVSAA